MKKKMEGEYRNKRKKLFIIWHKTQRKGFNESEVKKTNNVTTKTKETKTSVTKGGNKKIN